MITAAGSIENHVLRCAAAIRNDLNAALYGVRHVSVIGPAPYAVVRVNNKFRYRVTLLCHENKQIRSLLADIICRYNTDNSYKGVSVFVDANPTD